MPTTPCLPQLRLQFQHQRPLAVTFDAPATSSDGGWLLVRAVDDATGTTAALAAALTDHRRAPAAATHDLATLVRQRVYQIAAGYADANDATTLRHDPLLRLVCGRAPDGRPLASQPTLARLEGAATLRDVVAAQRALEARWVAGLDPAARAVVLDVDGTDDATHGQQQLAFYNAFYATTMLAPLLVFDQHGALASARLRGGKHHAHQFAGPLLERLLRAARARCPHAALVVRADAGFGQATLVNRLLRLRAELGRVELRLGLAPNAALQRGAAPALAEARARVALYGGCARYYDWVLYQAGPWAAPLPVVVRAEAHADGRTDVRAVVVTEPEPDARVAYEAGYAPRGDAAENRIKDFKRALAGDRLSCHRFAANALRLQLHAAAYALLHALRAHVVAAAPAGAPRPQLDTLRARLLKVAVTVRRTARRVWLALPRAFPAAALFRRLAAALAPAAPT